MFMLVLMGKIVLIWTKHLLCTIHRLIWTEVVQGKKAQQKLTFTEELLKIHQVTETVARDDTESGEATNLRALQATGEDVAVLEGSSLLKSSRPLAVTTSSLEAYLFRGSHPLLAGQMGLFLFFLY